MPHSRRPKRKRTSAGRAGTSRKQGSNVRAGKTKDAGGERLQKVLAAAGYGSRRACEELITTGRVEVDGEVVTELGARANPDTQKIRVDGELVRSVRYRYFAVNKPPGVVTTAADPSGRPRVVDLVPGDIRVFPVGRLDLSSEGLILLTNDGALANGLTHPRFGVRKVYHVLVAGHITGETLQALSRGMYLAEGFAKVVNVRIRSTEGKSTWLEMVLDEGRNREIRRLLARVGHKVLRLIRIEMGGVRLGEMPLGTYRQLTSLEVQKLRQAVRDSLAKKAEKQPQSAEAGESKPAPRKKMPALSTLRAPSDKKISPRDEGDAPPRKKKTARRPEGESRTALGGSRQGERRAVGKRRRASERRPGGIRRTPPRTGSVIGMDEFVEDSAMLPAAPSEAKPTGSPPARKPAGGRRSSLAGGRRKSSPGGGRARGKRRSRD